MNIFQTIIAPFAVDVGDFLLSLSVFGLGGPPSCKKLCVLVASEAEQEQFLYLALDPQGQDLLLLGRL